VAKPWLLVPVLILGTVAPAQQSARFTVVESTLNAGGHPADGVVPVSSSFRVTLGGIGDGLALQSSTSPSFRLDGGFVTQFPPPGEVQDLVFSDRQILKWSPEPSARVYHVYRDALQHVANGTYGTCWRGDLVIPTATDTDSPPLEQGFYYLATVENRLDEEGTKGNDSSGAERVNPAPCP
jgi:hypothetical protein